MEKLFLQILNMSISATYLILAVVVIRLFRSKMPKWVSVLLWGLVAVRLLCPFTPESMFSLIPKTQAVSPEILAPEVPNTNLDGGSFESGEIGTMGEIAGTGVIGDIPVSPPVVGGDSLPPASVGNAEEPIRLIAVLAVIWAVGVVVMLVYVAFGYGRIRKKIGTAIPMGNGVYQSDHINSAFVLGILKPKIYLPFSLQEKNLNHVVAHERAHIRRMDHLWKPLGFLLLAVHWFNPFMWVAFTLFCQDVEMACDEKVIAKFDYMERAAYSEALLSCSVKRRKKFAYPLTFGEIDTKGRVKSVLNYKKPTFAITCLSLVVCMLLAGCFLTDPVSDDNKDTEQETTLENDTGDTTETIPPESSDTETETEEPTPKIPYFDRMKTSKPTDEAVQKVEVGMTMQEVIDLIGYPHGVQPGSLFWETDSGKCFTVSLERGFVYFEEDKYDGVVATVTVSPFNDLVDFFDLTQTHRPTEEEALSIQSGMVWEDIYERLGKPHGFGGYAFKTLYWELENGKRFVLFLDYDGTETCQESCTHNTVLKPYYFHGKAKLQYTGEEVHWIIDLPQYDAFRD